MPQRIIRLGWIVAAMIAAVAFFAPASANAAISVDNVSTGSTDGGSSITISHTTSGSNRFMLVGVSINNDAYYTQQDSPSRGI